MKKLIALLTVAVLSVAVFAGPMVSPYFEIENVGVGAAPAFEFGAVLDAPLAPDWTMDLGAFYLDNDILTMNQQFSIGFDAGIDFDQYLNFAGGGNLKTGGSLSIGSLANYDSAVGYPTQIKLVSTASDFLLEGFVGPLSLWCGIDFGWQSGWTALSLTPTIGIRVEFNIPLDKPSTNI